MRSVEIVVSGVVLKGRVLVLGVVLGMVSKRRVLISVLGKGKWGFYVGRFGK